MAAVVPSDGSKVIMADGREEHFTRREVKRASEHLVDRWLFGVVLDGLEVAATKLAQRGK